ncbi:hypothetical protein B9Z55_029121 [Caenorhabditis nigoni]|uniref:SPK domain-containing protein n=1 Tax=Caenorhabditis nigoni TaxID=1611254 RepID=A0A2G5S917_9PELO|nr:hypothetical protein B9Z55_029121 [Caenorhabditis nigoni]
MAPYCGFDKLNVELLKFLVEQTTNATEPLVVMRLCELFAENQQPEKVANFYKNRILRFRHKIHQIAELDMDAKVKMLFAISVPIDSYFLEEMRKDADVIVDDRDRITYYNKKNGELELKGKHTQHVSRSASGRDEKLVALIVKKAETATAPIGARALAREFVNSTGEGCESHLAHRIRGLEREMWESSKFKKEERIKMMFVTSASLHERVLQELRNNATVHVDNENRITFYLANDGRLKLEGKPKGKVSRREKPQAKQPILEDSEPESPVKRTRKSTRSARRHVNSISESSDDEPPRKAVRRESNTKAKASKKEKTRAQCGDAKETEKEKEEKLADDMIYDGPDVLSPPPMIIKREPSVPSNSFKTELEETVETKPLVFQIEPQPSPQEQHEDVQKINSNEILNSLRSLVCTMDSPFLEKLQKNIENSIENYKENKWISVEDARTTFNYSLLVANRNAPDEIVTNSSKSLKLFFSLLKNSLYFLTTKSLESIHEKLKENIKQLEKQDKIISIHTIRKIVDSIYMMVAN